MRQAFHIFKKDIRYLRHEIAVMAVLCVAFAWGALLSFDELSISAAASIILAAIYLIVRVIQAEAIPGDRQFWITRPYRWRSLLLAKVAFIVVFVNLPIFAARLVILAGMKFPMAVSLPNLVWSHILLFFGVIIPAAAIAALTTGFVPFIVSAVIAAALVPVAMVIPRVYWNGSILWFQNRLLLVALAAGALSILWFQYKNRATRSSLAFCAAAIGLTGLTYSFLPPAVGDAAQFWLSPQLVQSSQAQVTVTATPQRWPNRQYFRSPPYKGSIQFRIAVAGLSSEMEGRLDSFSARLMDSSGQIRTVADSRRPGFPDNGLPAGAIPFQFTYNTYIDSRGEVLLDQDRARSITVQASLYLTIFGKPRQKSVNAHRAPENVLDGLQCYMGFLNRFICRAPLVWPSNLVLVKTTGETGSLQPYGDSPFPLARLDLLPLEERIMPGTVGDGEAVSIIVKEPLAYIRKEVEVHLNDVVDLK